MLLLILIHSLTLCRHLILPIYLVSSLVRLYTVNATGFRGVLTLPAVNATTLNITWRPPLMPNGNITQYNIEVNNRKNEQNQTFNIGAINGQEVYTQLVTGLSE